MAESIHEASTSAALHPLDARPQRRPRRRAAKSGTPPPLLVILAIGLFVVGLGGAWLGTSFLPLSDAEDGFRMQLGTVVAALEQGELLDLATENWLVFVHIGRALAVAPFLGIEGAFGAVGQLALLMIVLVTLGTIPYSSSRNPLVLVPLAIPLFLSGRGVLVSAGVAYVALYLLNERGRSWMLWFGALCANLSSASVLMALLLILFAKPRQARADRQWVQRLAVLTLLSLSLGASVSDKIAGFQSGETGYEAQAFGADNLLLAFISRATILISFSEGQLARALVYSAISVVLLFALTVRLRGPNSGGMRRLLLCGLPGIFLEGLGVVGLLFPLVWVFANFDPASRSRRRERKP